MQLALKVAAALALIVACVGGSALAESLEATVIYSDSQCNGSPVRVFMTASSNCSTQTCNQAEYNSGLQYRTTSCVQSNRHEFVADVFNGVSYVTLDYYNDRECEQTLNFTSSYLAAGTCQSGVTNATVITKLYSNGSAMVQSFRGLTCAGTPASTFLLDSETISNHTCVKNGYRFYSSMTEEAENPSDLSSSTSSSASAENAETSVASGNRVTSVGIIGFIVAGVVVLVGVIVFVVARVRAKDKQHKELETPSDSRPNNTSHSSLRSTTAHGSAALGYVGTRGSSQNRPSGAAGSATGLWDDEAIVAARLPREKILLQKLLSRGGYGEVHLGTFNGVHVAVKMLLPETRKSMRHVNEFLTEVKLMATLEHPRIARFVGVAWDSLSDLCVVSEFMAGGDLRALLSKYDDERRPRGFDKAKVQIALHVAHALTYLHSLEPPILHRDLKSKNILLSPELDAKLTDFGISRERVDYTMTAGVGTSLWMAPEVMMGEQYDDKADLFSFGVVLSELDSHALPYAHATDSNNSGRKMPDAVILQMVTMGRLQVEFSPQCLQSVAKLGLACVSVDPRERPTAAEALCHLHTILTREL